MNQIKKQDDLLSKIHLSKKEMINMLYEQILRTNKRINQSMEKQNMPSNIDLDSRERLIQESSQFIFTEAQKSELIKGQMELENNLENIRLKTLNEMKDFFTKIQAVKKY